MSSKRSKINTPPDPAPTAMPVPGREEDEAKKKARQRSGGGRASTRLAGMMMSRQGNMLNTTLG